MLIFPAIDLIGGKAVRLYKGDYEQMTVYNDDPLQVAKDFEKQGAEWMHLVDLEGARDGSTPNIETVTRLVRNVGIKAEIGGGIRTMDVIRRYLDAGVSRVILGTAAVTEEGFVEAAVAEYGQQIAVGVDLKDGFVAIRGWKEKTALPAMDFCRRMEKAGVSTLICTDISKDGAMNGTNENLYRMLSDSFSMQITASGGVSSLETIRALRKLDLYGAIIGKAYYTGAIQLREAIEVAK